MLARNHRTHDKNSHGIHPMRRVHGWNSRNSQRQAGSRAGLFSSGTNFPDFDHRAMRGVHMLRSFLRGALFMPRRTETRNLKNSLMIRAVKTLSRAAQPRMHGQLPVKGTREARSRAVRGLGTCCAARSTPQARTECRMTVNQLAAARDGIRNPRWSDAGQGSAAFRIDGGEYGWLAGCPGSRSRRSSRAASATR